MQENFESPRGQEAVSLTSNSMIRSSDISANNAAAARNRISQREISTGHRSLIDSQDKRISSTKAFVGLRLRHSNEVFKGQKTVTNLVHRPNLPKEESKPFTFQNSNMKPIEKSTSLEGGGIQSSISFRSNTAQKPNVTQQNRSLPSIQGQQQFLSPLSMQEEEQKRPLQQIQQLQVKSPQFNNPNNRYSTQQTEEEQVPQHPQMLEVSLDLPAQHQQQACRVSPIQTIMETKNELTSNDESEQNESRYQQHQQYDYESAEAQIKFQHQQNSPYQERPPNQPSPPGLSQFSRETEPSAEQQLRYLQQMNRNKFNTRGGSQDNPAADQITNQEAIMRQTAPPEMAMGSLHYVHDLASFEKVRSQSRDGAFYGNNYKAVAVTNEEANQILSYTEDQSNSLYNSMHTLQQHQASQEQLKLIQETEYHNRLMHARRVSENQQLKKSPNTNDDESGYHASEAKFRDKKNANHNKNQSSITWTMSEEAEEYRRQMAAAEADPREQMMKIQQQQYVQEAYHNNDQYIIDHVDLVDDQNNHKQYQQVAVNWSKQKKQDVLRVSNEDEKHSKPKVKKDPQQSTVKNITINQPTDSSFQDNTQLKEPIGVVSRSIDQSIFDLRKEDMVSDRDIAQNNNLMPNSIHELTKGASSKAIKNKTTGANTRKLSESYAPGSIKRLRKNSNDQYSTAQKFHKKYDPNQIIASRAFSQTQMRTGQTSSSRDKDNLTQLAPIGDDESSSIALESNQIINAAEIIADDYTDSRQDSRYKQKSRDLVMRRVIKPSVSRIQMNQVPSLARINSRVMKPNPSKRSLNDMFLPQHNEVGDEDWFTKMLMKSNQKMKTTDDPIIGGVETRQSLQLGQIKTKNVANSGKSTIRQSLRNSVDQKPSVQQTLQLVRSLNERMSKRKSYASTRSVKLQSKLYI